MDYLKGYKVFRNDPEWMRKIGIGTLLLLSAMVIPIAGQVVLVGWQALILRRAVAGQDAPLPRLDFDLNYLGKLLGTGFKAFIVRFLWGLPVGILAGALFVCIYFGILAVALGGAATDVGEAAGIGMMCCTGAAFLIFVPLVVVLSIPGGVAAMRAELTDDLNQGLRLREVLDFTKQMFRPLFVGSLALWLVGALLGVLGLLACYVGAFFVAVIGMVAQAHLYAQVYRAWLEQGGEPLPIAATDVGAPAAPGGPGAPGPGGNGPTPPAPPAPRGGWVPPPGS